MKDREEIHRQARDKPIHFSNDEAQETEIRTFWNSNPVGETLVRNAATFDSSPLEFFEKYDRYRYGKEGHIIEKLDTLELAEKEVLEIGLGQGADSEQIIRRGAKWSGIDLTEESVRRVETRMSLKSLPFQRIVCGSVVDSNFDNNSFDLIYSFGVLHHIPNIREASRQLHRILRPEGKLVVMVYARTSLNYYISIAVIRRIGLLLALAWPFGGLPKSVALHCEAARREGIISYLKMTRFIHANTDGPQNPYSKVYDVLSAKKDFAEFDLESAEKAFLHAPAFPVRILPFKRKIAKVFGWHLWLTFTPKQQSEND